MDPAFFADLQEALVFAFTPIVIGFLGVLTLGSILASIVNLFLDVAGYLYRNGNF